MLDAYCELHERGLAHSVEVLGRAGGASAGCNCVGSAGGIRRIDVQPRARRSKIALAALVSCCGSKKLRC